MRQPDHLLLHLILEAEQPGTLPDCSAAELAAYVRALLETLGSNALAVGATRCELTIVTSLPRTMSTAHLVHCIKRGTERWLNAQPSVANPFRWQSGYSAMTVDLRTLAETVREIHSRTGKAQQAATAA